VKDFANEMVKDHTESTQKLETAAEAQNLKLSPPSKLDADHQQKMDQLKNAKGDAFDKSYMQIQLDAHQKALDLHQQYAKSGDNAQLKQVAGEIAKVVSHHLDEAKKISGGMK
jgi:putative membrane protein